jgi:hypothetical protein
MNLEQFLDRLVAPGNFLVVATKVPSGIAHRFIPRSDVAGASNFIKHVSSKNQEVWIALASYVTKRNRTQDNVEGLKVFWMDADIQRIGDGKDPSKVFADRREVLTWVKHFCNTTGIPRPNLWVCSGYGLHLYWTFENALTKDDWQPYADALKTALIQDRAKGDTSIVADSARILRPIESFNFKDPANPAPTYEFYPDRLTQPDYPNGKLLGALAALPHYGSGVTRLPLPNRASPGQTPMTAAAKAGLAKRPYSFEIVASKCAQVRKSLDEGGAHDGRQIWWRMVGLAWFCQDGREFAHRVGNQHKDYTQAGTDKEFDRLSGEHAAKKFGAPTCKAFDAERPGICPGCEYYNTIDSPYTLGVVENTTPDAIPRGWQRHNGHIERKNKDGNWVTLIQGDVRNAFLERIKDHYRITFDYLSNQGSKTIQVEAPDIEQRTAKLLFTLRGVPLTVDNSPHFVRLIMAWIDLLRSTTATIPYAEPIHPFGWVNDAGGAPQGLAVGGTYYKTDGSEEAISGGDVGITERYQPTGVLAKWKEAAELVIGVAPEFQVAFSVAFGAPLMEFSGEMCLCLSFVGQSGRGKTSAFRAGASVWGDPRKTMGQLDDTENYISKQIGSVRSFPVYWDEVKINDRHKAQDLKTLLHKLTQGRDRGRLQPDIQVRAMGDWKTLFPFASNDSLISALSNTPGDNSATLLRLLEIPVDSAPRIVPDVAKAMTVSQLDNHYGHAGRVFIKWLVANTTLAAKIVERCKVDLIKITRATNEERFYIAGGAAILAGAGIARKLKLVDNLDIAAMQRVIVAAIRRAKDLRTEHAPTDPREIAAQWLERFCDIYTGERIVTRSIPTSGAASLAAGQAKFTVYPPLSNRPLAFQIGADDKIMRINKNLWRDWILSKGGSPDRLEETMEKSGWMLHRLARGRGKLGANTLFQSQQIPVIELNLQHPDLMGFAQDGVTATSNVIQMRP